MWWTMKSAVPRGIGQAPTCPTHSNNGSLNTSLDTRRGRVRRCGAGSGGNAVPEIPLSETGCS